MKTIGFSYLLTLILLVSSSCKPEETESLDMPPRLATQLEEFEKDPSEVKADSLLRAYQQMADTGTIEDAQIAKWYRSLAESLAKQEYWSLGREAHIQALRYDATGKNAPKHLIELAQQLHTKEGRLPISKAAYQSIVEYYPASDQVAEAESNLPEDQPSLMEQIQDLENMLMQQTRDSMKINHKVARDYVTAIQLLAAIDSDNEKAPLLLNRAAAIAKGLGNNQQAITLYNWVINDFEGTGAAKKALFYKGFTLDEEMGDYARAREAYDKFLEKYPEDELAMQVKILKEQLGKSDEEILEALKKGN